MIPAGYIPGMGRNPGEEWLMTHLYKGDYNDLEGPMCLYGWNRSDGDRFSILRNNTSNRGICSICMRRAKLGLPVFPSTYHKTRWL